MKISPPSATITATVSTATTTTTKTTAICSLKGFNFCYCCYLGVTDSNSVSAEIRFRVRYPSPSMCQKGSITWMWPWNAIKPGGNVPSCHKLRSDFKFCITGIGNVSYKIIACFTHLQIDSPAYTNTIEGPTHAPCFKVRVTVDGHAFESPDFFKSRKTAVHAAVNVALMSFPFDGSQEASSLTESCHMLDSVQGGSLSFPPMTRADCSAPLISDSSVGRPTGTRSYLLYNRIRVYPCVPDI